MRRVSPKHPGRRRRAPQSRTHHLARLGQVEHSQQIAECDELLAALATCQCHPLFAQAVHNVFGRPLGRPDTLGNRVLSIAARKLSI